MFILRGFSISEFPSPPYRIELKVLTIFKGHSQTAAKGCQLDWIKFELPTEDLVFCWE